MRDSALVSVGMRPVRLLVAVTVRARVRAVKTYTSRQEC